MSPESSHSEMPAEGVIVNFPQEMFNDALDFAAKAVDAELENRRFETWRWVKLCLICSVACFESYLNQLIEELKARIPVDVSRLKRKSISEKLFEVFPCCGLLKATINKGAQPYQDLQWLIDLRNDLVHYKGGPERVGLYTRELTSENAKRAVEAVRRMVQLVADYASTSAPPWVSQMAYVPIR